ncbi:MAG: Integrase, partial [uncultured Acetobacteraceae bacterium]
ARRRGGAARRDRRPGQDLRALRLPAGRGAAAGGGLVRQPQARGTDLAGRGAEGAAAAAETRPPVAERRLLRPAAAGAARPRLGVRLRRGPDAGRAPVPHALRGRRVHPRGAGHPGGAQARRGGRDRHLG